MEVAWQKIKSEIKNHIPAHSFNLWIEPVEFIREDNNYIVLFCSNAYFRKRVMDQYGSQITAGFRKITGKKINLKIEITRDKDTVNDVNEKNSPKKSERVAKNEKKSNFSFGSSMARKTKLNISKQLTLPGTNSIKLQSGRLLRKNFTFDKFVVGTNNDFAYSAAQSLAVGKQSVNNALFLLAGTGMGKSHLSQAVGHQILSDKPDAKVYYITAEDFTNEMVASFKTHTADAFKERYRTQCDVLLLEDTHFLTGKDATQKELSLTLDYLFEANKKIIFSGCYLPNDIERMNEQLKSRLSSGLISNIDVPDYKTRVKILRKKCKEKSYKINSEKTDETFATIPGEIIEYLAGELSENVRQLESGLMSVIAKSSLLGVPVDIALAESIIKNIAHRKKVITVETIKDIVCEQYTITKEMLVSKSRKQAVVRPRQMAIYLSRKYTDQPLKAIGKSFNRYHATALHSINSVERGIKAKGHVLKQLEFLIKKIENGKFNI